MTPNRSFTCFDLETTGLDAENDAIIEVAVCVFTFKEVVATYETLINPQRPIPEESTQIHKITDADVAGKPTIEQVLPELLKLIGDTILVGHMISTDIAFLKAAAKKYQIPFTLDKNPVIDTFRLARIYGESSDNSLQTLGKHFSIPETTAHRAMPDVQLNIQVFKNLISRPDYSDLDKLIKMLNEPIALKRMPLGKYKGVEISELPEKYLHWVKQWSFDSDLTYTLEQERKRRKKLDRD